MGRLALYVTRQVARLRRRGTEMVNPPRRLLPALRTAAVGASSVTASCCPAVRPYTVMSASGVAPLLVRTTAGLHARNRDDGVGQVSPAAGTTRDHA